MSKVKLIISDEPEEIIIQEGLNLNKFKKKIPHLLIRYVLSFLTTKKRDVYCGYGRFVYEPNWDYTMSCIFEITFKTKYLPIIIRNFEIANWNSTRCALKRREYGVDYLSFKSKTDFIQSLKDNKYWGCRRDALKLFIISGVLAKPFPEDKICENCERSKYSEQDYIKWCVRQGLIKCSCDMGCYCGVVVCGTKFVCECRFAKATWSKFRCCDCDSIDKI